MDRISTIAQPHRITLVDPMFQTIPLHELEKTIIQAAIVRHNYRMTDVARALQIGRSTLYRKIANLHLRTEPLQQQTSP